MYENERKRVVTEINRRAANAKAARRRARELYDRADRLLHGDLPEDLRIALSTTRTLTALAVMAFDAGKVEDGAIGLEMARSAMSAAQSTALAPSVRVGERVSEGGREGHEKTYGTPEEKDARRRAYVRDFDAARTKGAGIEEALSIAAKKHGVSPRTIRRARINLAN